MQPEGAKEQITVTVPTEAFELFLDILAQMANGNAVSIELSMTERGDPPHVNEWRGTGSGTLQGQDIIGRWQGTITCPGHAQFACQETNRQFRIRRTFR